MSAHTHSVSMKLAICFVLSLFFLLCSNIFNELKESQNSFFFFSTTMHKYKKSYSQEKNAFI